MRTQKDTLILNTVKQKSTLTGNEDFTNSKGERFIFENGVLTEYTDTRVIFHESDRLVNLAENPYFDEELTKDDRP
jgi:hypothetical protein